MPSKLFTALGLGLFFFILGCAAEKKPDGEEVTKTEEVKPKPEEPAEAPSEPAVDVDALMEKIGVKPGAFAIEKGVGSEGVLTSRQGTVSLRKAGEEEFKDITEDETQLYPGNQIRTATDSSAVLTLADETVVELAEDTTVAIADRDATADPASSLVVMAGVARFTVSERGQGEGPFLVYTPTGIIGTKGTTFAVGVAATGDVRVGVEDGEVEVAGGAELDSAVALETGKAVAISADGSVSGSVDFTTDDWGEWRDEIEAKATVPAMVEMHVKALGELETEIEKGYGDLEVLANAVAEAEIPVIEAKKADDGAAYEAAAPELGASVEASFVASTRLQFLTYAMFSRAYITNELYLRHTAEVKPIFVPAAPRVYGSILYHKKFHQVAYVHGRPWRVKYYHHHPRGRVHAVKLGHEVPKFYLKHKLVAIPDGAVRTKLKAKMYWKPKIVKFKAKKKVWIRGPEMGWYAKVKLKAKPHKARAKLGWYVKAKAPKAMTWRVKAKSHVGKPIFKARRPTKRGGIEGRIALGVHGKMGYRGKGKGKAKGHGKMGDKRGVKGYAKGRGKMEHKGAAKAKGKMGFKASAKLDSKKGHKPAAGAKANAKMKQKSKAKAKGKIGFKAGAKANAKMKQKDKAKAKGKIGFKVGGKGKK